MTSVQRALICAMVMIGTAAGRRPGPAEKAAKCLDYWDDRMKITRLLNGTYYILTPYRPKPPRPNMNMLQIWSPSEQYYWGVARQGWSAKPNATTLKVHLSYGNFDNCPGKVKRSAVLNFTYGNSTKLLRAVDQGNCKYELDYQIYCKGMKFPDIPDATPTLPTESPLPVDYSPAYNATSCVNGFARRGRGTRWMKVNAADKAKFRLMKYGDHFMRLYQYDESELPLVDVRLPLKANTNNTRSLVVHARDGSDDHCPCCRDDGSSHGSRIRRSAKITFTYGAEDKLIKVHDDGSCHYEFEIQLACAVTAAVPGLPPGSPVPDECPAEKAAKCLKRGTGWLKVHQDDTIRFSIAKWGSSSVILQRYDEAATNKILTVGRAEFEALKPNANSPRALVVHMEGGSATHCPCCLNTGPYGSAVKRRAKVTFTYGDRMKLIKVVDDGSCYYELQMQLKCPGI